MTQHSEFHYFDRNINPIYCGIDVGKHHHYLVGLDASGKKVLNRKCD